jgi:hypothetical protein
MANNEGPPKRWKPTRLSEPEFESGKPIKRATELGEGDISRSGGAGGAGGRGAGLASMKASLRPWKKLRAEERRPITGR